MEGESNEVIKVTINGSYVLISRTVFQVLLDNSVAGTYSSYENAINTRRISYTKLLELSQKGEIPLPLFFAPLPFVEEQVRQKTEKLLAGVSRETFSVGSRSRVELKDVDLIIKDLIRKQQLLRKYDKTLDLNSIVGILQKSSGSIDDDARRLQSALGMSNEAIQRCKSKTKALDLIIDHLESKQILVSRSVRNFMPQRLDHVHFSGITIRDNKIPYIFLAGGDHGDDQEPVGRTIFTLILMTVLIARRIFAPMTWDGGNVHLDIAREYDIAGAMLMPTKQFREVQPKSLQDIKDAADRFKVTASAVTVRALRLGVINVDTASGYLAELHEEFIRISTDHPRKQILPENAVRKYNGRKLTHRLLQALDRKEITPGEFCRSVCLNHIRPSQLGDLRRAVR